MSGTRVSMPEDVSAILGRHKPGQTVAVEYVDRTGVAKTAKVVLAQNPRMELVPLESSGGTLTAAQRAFRRAWLGSKG